MDPVTDYLRCVPCQGFCSPKAGMHVQHCIQGVLDEPGYRDAIATLARFASSLAASQRDLEPAAAAVLYENLWDLYE